jgi:hypothetical protein
MFVNCWHMNERESIYMWKFYGAHRESIGVQSTYRKLAYLLPHDAFVGAVKYIDYDTDYIDVTFAFNYIMHKRKSFEHERELRAVIWPPSVKKPFDSMDGQGLIVPIDPNKLIENIFVSPDSEHILQDVILQLARTYGVSASVHKSDVNAAPTY